MADLIAPAVRVLGARPGRANCELVELPSGSWMQACRLVTRIPLSSEDILAAVQSSHYGVFYPQAEA